MTLYQKLKWFLLSGITDTISETPQNRFKASPVTPIPSSPTPASDGSFLQQAQSLASSASSLADLYAARASFEGCALKHSAHTLNGYGTIPPVVLCLMDSPNTDDEKMEKLLSGTAGQKFSEMLRAIHLDIAANTYVSTLIPWRPPGNRKPTETEFSLCRPFWEKEITLLHPSVLLLFGSATCQQVLGLTSFMKACQAQHDFGGIPAFVCPTPAMILKDPDNYRRLAWDSLKRVQKHLESL